MAGITPGPFAPTLTQWVKTGETEDAKHNKVPTFTPRSIRALAEFPGGGAAGRATSTEIENEITADKVLLFPGGTSVDPDDEFTCSDAKRYKVQGVAGDYLSPFTGAAVTQVNLRRIT